ncbi:MAG TPA: divalent-cation tolerance protein CutA [Nitrospira sp.]|nr:divalent-cation tolerance protein CutA [Nitrospira sp.]
MRASSRRVIIVLITTANRSEAMRIAKAVVEKRLAACGNVIPTVTSIFRWEGRVQKSREALLVMKTTVGRYSALERLIRSMHSYKVPEIIGLNVGRGLHPYLEWVQEETAID